MNSLIIGIAGGSGSGKTTLALRLKARFGEEEVRLIPHDSYYKRHDELPYEERCKLNYDHPDSFDTDLLVEHLRALRRGETVQVPVYNYSIHNRSDKTVTVSPARASASGIAGIPGMSFTSITLRIRHRTCGTREATCPARVHLSKLSRTKHIVKRKLAIGNIL